KHYIQRQVNLSAVQPFLNWAVVQADEDNVVLPTGQLPLYGAYAHGATWIAPGSVNNTLAYVPTGAGITTIAQSTSPAAGDFTPAVVVYSPELDVVCYGGANSSNASRSAWLIEHHPVNGVIPTEQTVGAGPLRVLAVDPVDGHIYGIASNVPT